MFKHLLRGMKALGAFNKDKARVEQEYCATLFHIDVKICYNLLYSTHLVERLLVDGLYSFCAEAARVAENVRQRGAPAVRLLYTRLSNFSLTTTHSSYATLYI